MVPVILATANELIASRAEPADFSYATENWCVTADLMGEIK
jgi:hypothetical protein